MQIKACSMRARRLWADRQMVERVDILFEIEQLIARASTSKKPIDHGLLEDILSIGVYDVETLPAADGKECMKLTLNPIKVDRWVTVPERCVNLPAT